MTEMIIPLPPRGAADPALARIDRVAVELLAEGQAASLQAARIEVILTDMRTQRDHLTALLADLRGREPTGDLRIEATDADFITAIDQGVVQIDLFIARAQFFASDAARSRSAQPSAPGSAP